MYVFSMTHDMDNNMMNATRERERELVAQLTLGSGNDRSQNGSNVTDTWPHSWHSNDDFN